MAKRTASNDVEASTTSTDQGEEKEMAPATISFDMNDPSIEEASLSEVNLDRDAEELPPPPPDSFGGKAIRYSARYDFGSDDPAKIFQVKPSKKGPFLMVSVVGTIVNCANPDVPERAYLNRKIYDNLMSLVNTDGRSGITDWLKSVGKKEELKVFLSQNLKGKAMFDGLQELISSTMAEGPVGDVAITWHAQFKDENDLDDNDKPKYKTVKRGMKNFPLFADVDERAAGDNPYLIPFNPLVENEYGEEVRARAEITLRFAQPAK